MNKKMRTPLEILIDDELALVGEDVIRLKSRYKNLVGKPIKTSIRGNYLRVTIGNKSESYHRIKFYLIHGFMPEFVDHKDGNTFNNLSNNLRESTPKLNQFNRKCRKDRKYKYPKGVYPRPNNRFQARININGSYRSLGTFGSVDEAQQAYLNKAKELVGEHANAG